MNEALNLYRRVVDCLTSGQQIDKQELAGTNLALATALDRAKVYNLPTDDLEAARDAVLHLYEVLWVGRANIISRRSTRSRASMKYSMICCCQRRSSRSIRSAISIRSTSGTCTRSVKIWIAATSKSSGSPSWSRTTKSLQSIFCLAKERCIQLDSVWKKWNARSADFPYWLSTRSVLNVGMH